MTSPSSDSAGTAQVPPPGCPAHGLGPGGLHRLYGPEVENNAVALYEQLREAYGGVAPVLVHGDIPAWLVLGYRENLEVTKNPTRFSRDSRLWRPAREGQVPPDNPLLPLTTWVPMCSFIDGDEHKRLRAAVTDTMKRMQRPGPRRYVKRFANQLIDTFAHRGHADLVVDFAQVLPMLVMTRLLGMPEEFGPRLVEAARDMVKASETAIDSNAYIVETLQGLVAKKKHNPGEDFASWLIDHESRLTDDELVEHLRLVLIAAYSTTANLIANTLHMVLTDGRFRGRLAGGVMTLPDALEQVLWDAPPFTAVYGRWATGDTELDGHQIKEGDMLVLGLAAGNVDPAIRPDLSKPVHGNRSHLAFSGGPHECPGQDIGRAIADTGIDALLFRLPDLHLAIGESEVRWHTSLLSRELITLPVEFTAEEATAPVRSAPATAFDSVTPPDGASASPAEWAAGPPPAYAPMPAPPRRGWRARWQVLVRWLRGG